MRKLVSIVAIAVVCTFAVNAQSGKVLTLDQKVNGAITKASNSNWLVRKTSTWPVSGST